MTNPDVAQVDRDFVQAAYDAERGSGLSIYEVGKVVFPGIDDLQQRTLCTFLKCKAKGWLLGSVDAPWVTREGKRLIGQDLMPA